MFIVKFFTRHASLTLVLMHVALITSVALNMVMSLPALS